MLNLEKNQRDNQLPFLLTANCEGPPPIPYRPFSAEAEKNLSLCYNILLEVGEWSNVTTTSKLEQELSYYITDLVIKNPFSWKSKILVCNHGTQYTICTATLGIATTSLTMSFVSYKLTSLSSFR